MKKLLTVLVVLLVLVGCGSGNGDKPVLRVYNWGEYIDEDVIVAFEKEFGVRVQYDNFFSNEDMYTRIASESYDVLVPSDYMIQRLIEEDKLMELDYSKLPNAENVDAEYRNRHFDVDNKYSVPYFVGSVGLVYNKTVISESDIENQGWDILRNTDYTDRIFFYNSERDAFMIALKSLGYSMNTADENELQEAYEWLVAMKQEVNPVYVDDYVIDAMEVGEKDIAVMYSGDATYVLSVNDELGYIEPKQGTNVWIDAMVIPKDAPNADLAHAFMNFILEPENQEAISIEVGYTSPISSVAQSVGSKEYEGIEAYFPRTGFELDEEFYYNAETKVILGDLWNKLIAAN